MLFSSSKHQGEYAEVSFVRRALALGLTVSRPGGDRACYDFIVDCGRHLRRVQVKSALVPQQGFFQIKTGSGHRSKRAYSPRTVDVLAAYLIPRDSWYIIPVSALRGRKTIRVCPHRSSCRPFERYREAWHLLTASHSRLA